MKVSVFILGSPENVTLFAHIQNPKTKRWKRVAIYIGPLVHGERWFTALMKKYHPTRPRLRFSMKGSKRTLTIRP